MTVPIISSNTISEEERIRIRIQLRGESIARFGFPRCTYCHRRMSNQGITLDHVLPKSLNGPDSPENFVLSCKRCNSHKASVTLQEWAELLQRILQNVREMLSSDCDEGFGKETPTKGSEGPDDELSAVIERLQQTVHRKGSIQFLDGKAAGSGWAKESATLEQLQSIAVFEFDDFAIDLDAVAAARGIAAQIFGESELPKQGMWYHGFLCGAAEIWRAVDQRV